MLHHHGSLGNPDRCFDMHTRHIWGERTMTAGNNSNVGLKENIVGRIVSVFADVPPQRDIMIFADEVFAQARVRLEEMARTARAAYFEGVIDERLERLRTLGCPAFMLRKLQAKKADVVSKACALNIPAGRDSLIPVIPSHYMTIYSQLEMINLNGITGDTDLEASHIIIASKKGIAQNDSRIFDSAYFILNIDDGANTEKLTCAEADERFQGKNRFPLTVEEIIAVLLQKTEPPAYNLLAAGSRYDQDDRVPVFTVADNKMLVKTCYYSTIHPNSVTPSCGARV